MVLDSEADARPVGPASAVLQEQHEPPPPQHDAVGPGAAQQESAFAAFFPQQPPVQSQAPPVQQVPPVQQSPDVQEQAVQEHAPHVQLVHAQASPQQQVCSGAVPAVAPNMEADRTNVRAKLANMVSSFRCGRADAHVCVNE